MFFFPHPDNQTGALAELDAFNRVLSPECPWSEIGVQNFFLYLDDNLICDMSSLSVFLVTWVSVLPHHSHNPWACFSVALLLRKGGPEIKAGRGSHISQAAFDSSP